MVVEGARAADAVGGTVRAADSTESVDDIGGGEAASSNDRALGGQQQALPTPSSKRQLPAASRIWLPAASTISSPAAK